MRVFTSPTGTLIREVIGEAQTDPHTAQAFRDRFWQPRRDLSAACLRRGIERGQVRADIDVEAVLDALYGPIWLRLIVGHRAIRATLIEQTLDPIWRGVATRERSE